MVEDVISRAAARRITYQLGLVLLLPLAVGCSDKQNGVVPDSRSATVADQPDTTVTGSEAPHIRTDSEYVSSFINHLQNAQWAEAATETSLGTSEILQRWGVEPKDHFAGFDTAALLESFCTYGEGLCIAPTRFSESDDGRVLVAYADSSDSDGVSTASFVVEEGLVAGLPPISKDQTGSRCLSIQLLGNQLVSSDPGPPSSSSGASGVIWNGLEDDAQSIWLSWAPLDAPKNGGSAVALLNMTFLDQDSAVYEIEGGLALDFNSICGRHTVWSYGFAGGEEFRVL